MLYRTIDVWKRYADHVVRYRCFELLPIGKYCVQSADSYYSAKELGKDDSLERQFLELLLEQNPEERSAVFDTLQEAITGHDRAFSDFVKDSDS